jgi:hypothetical protein
VVQQAEHAAVVAKHRNKWSFQTLQKMCECLVRLERFGPEKGDELQGAYVQCVTC